MQNTNSETITVPKNIPASLNREMSECLKSCRFKDAQEVFDYLTGCLIEENRGN